MAKQVLEIGFFSTMYSQINGTAHAVRFLSEAIAKLGHNVHVFAPRVQNGYKRPKTLHFHEIGGVMIAPKTGFVLSAPIHKIFFCQHDYLDISHIHTHAVVGSMAVNWSKYLGIPMVGTHNSPMQYYTAQYVPIIGKLMTKGDLIWRYERHIVDKYDFVHVATKSKKDLLRDYRFKEPIVCMTNGVHDSYFTNLKENGIREKYNLEGKKVLLYASRLSPEKHPIDDMDAFELTQEIRKLDKYRHTPIVLLTSKNSEDIIKPAIIAGITDVFQKENVHELVNFIERFTQVEKPIFGKILYIEDQKSQREYITAIFKERELEVDAFENAEDALQAYLKKRYHLIITDIVLAGEVSGVLLINKIRRLDGPKGDVPILAVTAFDDNSRRISLYHMGITDYVTKPIIKEELLARVRNLIKNQKALEREIDFREHLNSEEVVRRGLKLEALGKLTGGIAHDYNNMLGVITGYTQLLKDKLGDKPKLLSYVEQIAKAGTNGAKLTSKLLAFTRKDVVSSETVNINTLIIDSQPMLEKLLTASIRLKTSLDEDIWNTTIDKGDFENALLNMCINAKHAMGEKGLLTIITSNNKLGVSAAEKLGLPEGEYIRLSIMDSGCGMDREMVTKIFDPFFSTKGEGGTGLGLSQVYGFIQRINGSIKVESKPGKGTLFNLYFPREKGKGIIKSEAKVKADTNIIKKVANILVVDDEVALAELTAEILMDAGHQVQIAHNANEALDAFANNKFDVMVSDVIMPGLNGFELAKKVKGNHPDIKIIIVSGYNDKINLDETKTRYHNEHLEKPVSSAQLLDSIDSVLN